VEILTVCREYIVCGDLIWVEHRDEKECRLEGKIVDLHSLAFRSLYFTVNLLPRVLSVLAKMAAAWALQELVDML